MSVRSGHGTHHEGPLALLAGRSFPLHDGRSLSFHPRSAGSAAKGKETEPSARYAGDS